MELYLLVYDHLCRVKCEFETLLILKKKEIIINNPGNIITDALIALVIFHNSHNCIA